MFNQISYDIYKTLKKAVLKKFDQFFDINYKREKFILLRILDQIQQDHPNARDGINKSVAIICNEGGISFEQVFYVLFFDAAFISKESNFSLYFDQLLEQRIHSKSTDNSLDSLCAVICMLFCSFLNCLCEMTWNSSRTV